ncbi:MAG: Thymidylate kinase [Alphaproteobacteria bacterium]|nr:Thymidylate kinase [Alphaproteobacteria bacterium]MDB5740448.1 Thymidylate kinase [Alphaproteobacteria bacterium]
MTGRFITLEGGEGTGKSTQVKRLKAALEAKGLTVLATREPGGSPGAEEIRRLLVEGEPGRWNPITETLLAYAARADHVARTIGPALATGAWVISDRFNDSTFAYQGVGRGVERETIRRIDSAVLDDFQPDLTLVLDLDVKTGLERAHARTDAKSAVENRFEKFGPEFHERLRQSFLDIAKRAPERCRVIDASGSPDAVAEAIFTAVARRFDL